MNEDGTMARMPDLIKVAERFQLKLVTIKDLIAYRIQNESLIEKLKNEIGDERVICGLSGGVDSTVTALLLHRAIKNNLTCIFVDNGLLRKQEANQIEFLFKKHFKIKLKTVKAKNLFLQNLKGVIDPEKKRKIIGKLFINVFEREAKKTVWRGRASHATQASPFI